MDRGFNKLPIITSSMIYTTVMSPESYYHYLQALHLQLSLISYLSSEDPIRVSPPSSGFKIMEVRSSTTNTIYIHSKEEFINKVQEKFNNNGGPGEDIGTIN
ncbi:hypothetical protein HanRHA438_Chr15g0706051 [Helianthus annuus]|uniref:Uncharacterized protein n=1 Tax=Helianthus annuus TaxID=4232 RepID=A0A251SAA6_HELAN|nr:hypothetical protein HanXRQr2_Chr15g0693741 [Helianthus annuus]KAJ0451235.1 hypothetical protein HanHA300_Chr15g0565301 [Helianthus annuus]KAJ0455688.1 hypothetical protein HanIR_Chr15g0754011 [Helianthus annuus]KAJ0473103.1 hypothetical protein HanHA89_Chr15g0614571 [Helianthus annuus]KAJ0629179.1 hypothetical protein HanIR_Chr00c23g0910461 [Helianthus annuus]